MTLFEVYICILGTIYVIDKIIDTLLNIVTLGDNIKNETANPEQNEYASSHIKSMYS